MAKHTCPRCSKPCESEEGCFLHKPRKPLASGGRLQRKGPTEEAKEARRCEIEQMNDFFLHIWNSRPHYSELTPGKWLGHQPLTTFFHHILPKSEYPQARFDPQNIILLSWEQHQKVEQDPSYYPEINARRLMLLTQYNKQS